MWTYAQGFTGVSVLFVFGLSSDIVKGSSVVVDLCLYNANFKDLSLPKTVSDFTDV